jgi:DNA-binding NtrC family response regulator
MPGLDGFEVLDRLNEERPDLPVVIVTAHGTVDQAAEAIREGAESFVHKPFSPEQVRSVVAQALAEKPDAPDRTYDEHVQLTRVGIREEDFEKARRHIQEAFALDATRPEAFNLLGVLMQIQSKFQEAQRYYQSALSLRPGYEPAVYNRDNLARSPSVRDPSDYRLE